MRINGVMKNRSLRAAASVLILAFIFSVFVPLGAFHVGEVINHVLYTEIKAYINGVQIPACNVSGRMMVTAEDLSGYGFDVYWDADERTLKVYRNGEKAFSTVTDLTDWGIHNPGDIVGDVLYTDIVTYLEDVPCEAFNIGGRTVVALRSLAVYGTVDYDDPTHTASLELFESSVNDTPSESAADTEITHGEPAEKVQPQKEEQIRSAADVRKEEFSALRDSLTEKTTDSAVRRAIKRIQLAILNREKSVMLDDLGLKNIYSLLSEFNMELYGFETDYTFKLSINKNFWHFGRVNMYYRDNSGTITALELNYVLENYELGQIRDRYSDEQLESIRKLMLTMYNYYDITPEQFFELVKEYDYPMLYFVLTAVSEEEIENGTAMDSSKMNDLYRSAQSVIPDINKWLSDVDRIRYLHDSIIGSFDFEKAQKIHSPSGMLETGEGVCQAYSLLLKYYLDMLGYDNCLAVNSGHQWNMVKIGGEWYHVDLTWDEASPDKPYKYFLKSDRAFSEDHEGWNAEHRASSDKYDSAKWQ